MTNCWPYMQALPVVRDPTPRTCPCLYFCHCHRAPRSRAPRRVVFPLGQWNASAPFDDVNHHWSRGSFTSGDYSYSQLGVWQGDDNFLFKDGAEADPVLCSSDNDYAACYSTSGGETDNDNIPYCTCTLTGVSNSQTT